MLVRKTEVVPIECVVRGYLSGSAGRSTSRAARCAASSCRPGCARAIKLPEPIFTPATKAEIGEHDENISFDDTCATRRPRAGRGAARAAASSFTRAARAYARERGIIIADTKFEFGQVDGELILIDEVLTPDSSRFWPADGYEPGRGQPSFDKQFVRDWLTASGWDKNSPPPELPAEVVAKTRAKYIEAFERI